MFRVFIMLLVFLMMPQLSRANPIETITCEMGGEFGRLVTLKLKRNTSFGKLTIYRQHENAEYLRDLSTFKGGSYKLDLSPRGGIKGLKIEYKENGQDVFTAREEPVNCDNTVEKRINTVTTDVITKPTINQETDQSLNTEQVDELDVDF
ncbi:hypothetical protein BVY03_02075 [bacterium K02(2017)]|nr:hypothetical protein BVY03_02075 [bacterium K02(2017)]